MGQRPSRQAQRGLAICVPAVGGSPGVLPQGQSSHLVGELTSGQSTVELPPRGSYRHTESHPVPKCAWEALLALGQG